jgi:hypothetical protein
MGTVAYSIDQEASKSPKNVGKIKKGGGPGLPASLVSRFREMPAGLTEGGQPVVCWPARETPMTPKKFRAIAKK